MSQTGLKWCPGCQTNVKPSLMNECPRCGTSVSSSFDPELDKLTNRGDLDIEPLSFDTVKTVSSGRLVLNPKVDGPGRNPLCPDCEEPIKRVEHDQGPFDEEPLVTVEFVCGCDDLRYFEFEESGSSEST